jgi:diguanylate cyclase (GGDEF)-like protein
VRRAPLALGALGLLDLALLGMWEHLAARPAEGFSAAGVLVVSLAAFLIAGPAARGRPRSSRPESFVSALGLILVVGSVVLPATHLIVLCAGGAIAAHRSLRLTRRVGTALVDLAAVLTASATYHLVSGAALGDSERWVSAACVCAGVVVCLVTALLVTLLVRYVDGVPFRQQPIWQPQHYARAQAFDLLGSLAAFLLLVSPWSLLFLGGPQLLLAGLLLKDAGSSAAAEQDAKTGLLNHPAFVSRARAELGRAARHEDPVSLLVLDLDHLREINNRHGHPVGDLAIAAVADVLRGTLRAHDLAARVGGEEFLVLLPCTDLRGAMEVAGRIRGDLAATSLAARSGEVVVTASVGVAQVEADEAWESLYERADQALLAAKRSGRDRVEPAQSVASGQPA